MEHARYKDGVDQRPQASTAATPLSLVQLRLVNYRSYSEAALTTAPRPVVLAGANGSGKTNCLEAISLLSPGRGLRGARLNDIQRKAPLDTALQFPGPFDTLGASLWAVAATVLRDDTPWDIGTALAPLTVGTNSRRVMHLNGAPAQATDLAELIPMLWLTPAQDRLFVESASDRRRFLDRLVYGLDEGHARRVARYERAMRERARLLRDGRPDPVWLDSLEDTMVESGIAVTQARLIVIEKLNGELDARDGAFPCAHLSLEDGAESEATDADALRRRLVGSRIRDAESGRTNVGPHLADLTVRHTGKRTDARDCSTGEQKALLISIVLANAWLQKRRNRVAPFLLLDEIAAHLDADRRAALFEEILTLSAQAWMTGTDRSLFAPLEGSAAMVSVVGGRFEQVS